MERHDDRTLGLVAEKFLKDPRRAQGRLVDAGDMRPFASDPGNALTEPFIDEAVQKGDRCYALFDGDVLMSYGWYSTRSTRLTEIVGEPVLHFDMLYAYMYNGFTLPKYRGQRLHAIGMAAALEKYTEDGQRGARLVRRLVELCFAQVVLPDGIPELRPCGHAEGRGAACLALHAWLQEVRLPRGGSSRLTKRRGPEPSSEPLPILSTSVSVRWMPSCSWQAPGRITLRVWSRRGDP